MVGLFNKGDSLARLPLSTISNPIYQPVFRSMAADQDNPDRIKYLFFTMISLLTLYTLPIYVGLWWLAEPFIIVVYGRQWADAAIPLQILAPLGLLYCVGHPCGAVLTATDRVGKEIVVQTITWVMVGFGCYFGLRWGLAGVAAAIVLSQLYSATHMYLLANDCFRARLRELVAALMPGVFLNAILVVTLLVTDLLLPDGMRTTSMATYLVISTLAGGSVYALAFLLLPLPSLASEAMRWKRFLRLSS
jgi:teichuronic acid exporter